MLSIEELHEFLPDSLLLWFPLVHFFDRRRFDWGTTLRPA